MDLVVEEKGATSREKHVLSPNMKISMQNITLLHHEDPKVCSKTANYIQMGDDQRRQYVVDIKCLPFFGNKVCQDDGFNFPFFGSNVC